MHIVRSDARSVRAPNERDDSLVGHPHVTDPTRRKEGPQILLDLSVCTEKSDGSAGRGRLRVLDLRMDENPPAKRYGLAEAKRVEVVADGEPPELVGRAVMDGHFRLRSGLAPATKRPCNHHDREARRLGGPTATSRPE
jgi:hypothetical protein